MRNVVSDVENLLHEVSSSQANGTVHAFKSGMSRALDAARDRLDAARDRLNELDGSMRTGARQAATVTDDYAHEHPWQAMAAGALVGLAIGLLIARR
jgi:ElaB/YqjD/DUF883 family membrane-anchored ribosome-binding protein